MKKNDFIELCIDDIAHSGDGVGRCGGMAVFVPMTAPGDRLLCKIVQARKSFAFGIIHELREPSVLREENGCPAFRRCGGCSLRHLSYEAELAVKSRWAQENLRRIGGINLALEPILPSPRVERYRNKAQYPIRNIGGKIRAGFFQKRSHELVAVDDCLLQPAIFSALVAAFTDFCDENGIAAYDEKSHTGVARHLFLRLAEKTGEIMACVVANGAFPHEDKLAARLLAVCPALKTLVINENRERTNVIFGPATRAVFGGGFITDELAGVRVKISAQSFYQVNREAAERLYGIAKEYASPQPGDTLLDLFCGAGAIGLSMARSCREVVGIESVAEAVADARENAAANGIDNARFFCSDAENAGELLRDENIRPDIAILDPPRKGAEPETLRLLAELGPRRIVYISCDSATLARDLKILCGTGYAAVRGRAVDMFPRTAHVETVVLLERLK